eukprot:Selendium_serpulae@DN6318_c1_g1_i9.p1
MITRRLLYYCSVTFSVICFKFTKKDAFAFARQVRSPAPPYAFPDYPVTAHERRLAGQNAFPDYPMATEVDMRGRRKTKLGGGGAFQHQSQFQSQTQYMGGHDVPVPVPVPDQEHSPMSVGDITPQIARTQPPYIKNEYVVTTEAEFTCPRGYNFDGSKCSKYDQIESRLGCRQGWKYENEKCVGVDTRHPEARESG